MTTDSAKDINGNFKGKDILSTLQFSKKDIDILFDTTDQMKKIITI